MATAFYENTPSVCLLWDDEELIILKDKPTHTPTFIRAEELELELLKSYCSGNGFKSDATGELTNLHRSHTFVAEFDELPLDAQLEIVEQIKSEVPITLVIFSGGKSLHLVWRLVEDILETEWRSIAKAIQKALPDACKGTLTAPNFLFRMPGAINGKTGQLQKIRHIDRRVYKKELVAWLEKKGCYVEHIDKPSLQTLQALHNNPVVERGKRADEFIAHFEKSDCFALYRALVEKNFYIQQGQRNITITQKVVPFLFRAVAESVAMAFIEALYWHHAGILTDPIEQHMQDAQNQWRACFKNYPAELLPGELAAYSQMIDPQIQALFRICRDLSKNERDKTLIDGEFALSAEQCRLRLGLKYDEQGRRLIDIMHKRKGLIQLMRKGRKRGKGQRGVANVYRWILSRHLSDGEQ